MRETRHVETAHRTAAMRARLTMIDIEPGQDQRYPVVLGGVLNADDRELYIALPGVFWPGTRFRVDYAGEQESITVFASVARVDPESPDGTERLGHMLHVIPDPFEEDGA
ncbi:MAG: hypothetical protein P4L33_04910 [Capsulimonadaceae bacterium]|nr:hypothetical protein [Capsulimonadaceae bacterium]